MKSVGTGCQKTALVAVIVDLTACLSWAGNGTWTNTVSGGLWSTSDNWSSGAIADGSGFTADFSTVDITADNTVHLDGPRTLKNLTFGDTSTNTAAGWVLDNNGNSGNVLTLAGATPTLTVNALGGSSGVTFGVQLAGTAGLIKAGTGTLTLTSTNTYTGATAVNGGTLALSGNGALVTNTAITINGGILDMGSQNATNYLGNNTGVVFGSNGGSLNGTGTFTILGQNNGGTSLTVPANANAIVNANIVIANTNTASAGYGELANVGVGGTLTINGKVKGYSSGNGSWMKGGGTLVLNNPSNQMMSAMNFWQTAGAISTPYFSALGSVMVMGQGSTHGAATFIYTGVATNTTLYFTPASLAIAVLNNGSGAITFTGGNFTSPYGAPNSATAQKLKLGGWSDMTIWGKIQNANGINYLTALVKTNANTVTLTAANTYSAGTTIAGGVLQLGDGTSGRDGTIIGNIQNDAALVYNLYSTQTVNTVISGSGSVTKTGAGTLTLAGANTYSGATTISGGTLKLGLANAITNTGAINVAGGTYDLGGFTVTNGPVTISAGTVVNGTLVGASYAYTDAGLVAATLAGTGTVTKSGAGTLALRGVNTFTGPLTISGGTVEIQASPATGSAVWLDAAMISSMAKNTDGTGGVPAQGDGVGRWTSLSGSNWVSSASKPTYQTNVLNGLPILRLAGGIPFMSNVVAQGSTVFMVYRRSGVGSWANPLDSQNQTPISGWLHMINDFNNRCLVKGGGQVSVGSTFPSTNWAVQAVQIQTNDYRLWINESAYGPSTATNEFTAFTHLGVPGDFAEVLIYTNLLNSSDRMTTISYLQKKWLGVSGTSSVTNSLSPLLSAEVKAGAVLDLCGGSQTLVALSGSGRVTNGTVTVTGRLAPGDTSASAGVLTVGGNLILAAGATNVFDCVSAAADTVSVAGTLTLQGANTVDLSLNGQPPPAQMTLFTFSSLVGEAHLATWAVQGAGLGPYATKVKRLGNSVVLYAFRNGTLLSVR